MDTSNTRDSLSAEPVASAEVTPARPDASADEPPVVARLVIELRSDGTRTVARGAMDDVVSGQRVAIEARGGSPAELTVSLAGSIFKSLATIPKMTFRAARTRGALRDAESRPQGTLRDRVQARLRRAARRLGLP